MVDRPQIGENLPEKSVMDLVNMIPQRKWPVDSKARTESIAGSMFSGKTEEMMRRIRRARIAKQKAEIFKPIIDNRYGGIRRVSSHNGLEDDATPVGSARDILIKIIENKDSHDLLVVGIDEAQFFDNEIIEVVEGLRTKGFRIITTGLNLDFKREPFGPMPDLLSHAEEQTKLHAICTVCGGDADYTQREVNGVPASYGEKIILVGAKEAYDARCREHHVVLNAPPEKRVIFQDAVDWYEGTLK